MHDLLAGSLTFVAVVAVGGAIIVNRLAKRQPLESRVRQLQGQAKSDDHAGEGKLTGLLGSVGAAVSSGRVSQKLKAELAMAGFYNESAATMYLGFKMVLLLLGVAAGVLLVSHLNIALPIKFCGAIAAGGLASFMPNIFVTACRQQRRNEVLRTLPDAIDLLEICVSAGMGLDTAWNLVSDSVRQLSPILADEMALTNLEIHLGASRVAAMRNLARRTGSDELSSLAAVLIQSDRFGTSVADALRIFSTSMRESRTMKAEEKAEKMAVKLLLPMVVFIFPAVLLVVAGSAILTLARIMSH
jgi:tight adherence protein C